MAGNNIDADGGCCESDLLMFTLRLPRKVIFGSGSLAQLGHEAAALGGRSLIVCGGHAMRAAGVLRRATDLLTTAGVESVLFDRVEQDPSCATVTAGTQLARREHCDVVIGLGGGSSIDAAKAIAVMIDQEGSVQAYHDGERTFERLGKPMIAVPTTAGSGAEATRNAVLTNRVERVKKSLRGPGLGPSVALVDPELTLTMPPAVTAGTGMDALTQAVECYVSAAAHPVSDALSLQAMDLIFHALPKAYHNGAKLAYREPAMLGSLLTGLAFADAGLGAVHGLAHPLGLHLDLPHGFVCGVLLPLVLAFNYEACTERFARMATTLGLESGAALIPAVRALTRELGLPETLGGHGLREDMFPTIVAQSHSNSRRQNPRPVTDADVIALLHRLL